MSLNNDDIEALTELLQRIADDTSLISDNNTIKSLIAKVYKEGRRQVRREIQDKKSAHDRALLEETGRCKEENPISETAPKRLLADESEYSAVLLQQRKCYSCKESYNTLDNYYHMLCPRCATQHKEMRDKRVDLTGKSALITGGRIKIGFQLALKMLRDGARVLITTRFPKDAIKKYAKEPDFESWKDRIKIFNLDFRQLHMVNNFITRMNEDEQLDILVNNAAQTISRPQEYYSELIEAENLDVLESEREKLLGWASDHINQQLSTDKALSKLFPRGMLGSDGQQLDLREKNSWLLSLAEVPLNELLEVHVVNTFAPFMLIQGLVGLMTDKTTPSFIINVSAMEGQFNRANKTVRHVHTNMAKAGLNMVTRTSAADLQKCNIFMNSVDTGWITQENPFPVEQRIRENGFVPPLDEIDGAARIYAPIIDGMMGKCVFGKFLKDYRECPW